MEKNSSIVVKKKHTFFIWSAFQEFDFCFNMCFRVLRHWTMESLTLILLMILTGL